MKNSIKLASLVLLTGSLAACGSKTDAGAAGSSAPAAGSASAASKAELPKGDPAVVAELKKVASCEREEGYQKSDCDSSKAWQEYSEKYVEEDDLNLKKAKTLAGSCLSLVADANDNVREEAFNCVGSQAEAVADPAAAIGLILEKVEAESSVGVRTAMLGALRDLDPTKHKQVEPVLALAKKLVDHKESGSFSTVVRSLIPSDNKMEPTPEAVAFAIQLIADKKSQRDAVDVLVRTKTKTDDACKALLALVETKKHPWGAGLDGMGRIEGNCKEHTDAMLAAVIERAGQKEGYDQGLIGADVIYLSRLVEKLSLSDEQKKKLKAAVEPLVKAAKQEHTKKDLEKLVALL